MTIQDIDYQPKRFILLCVYYNRGRSSESNSELGHEYCWKVSLFSIWKDVYSNCSGQFNKISYVYISFCMKYFTYNFSRCSVQFFRFSYNFTRYFVTVFNMNFFLMSDTESLSTSNVKCLKINTLILKRLLLQKKRNVTVGCKLIDESLCVYFLFRRRNTDALLEELEQEQ